MNFHPYGIPKELYRTSYVPSLENPRPSSLSNLSYVQSYGKHAPLPHFEPQNSTSVIKEINRSNLSISQTNIPEGKTKLSTQEYFPQSRPDQLLKILQAKYEELSKKVTKNSQDIKILKHPNKLKSKQPLDLTQELALLKRRHQTFQQECLSKIKSLQDQLSQTQSKLPKPEDSSDKYPTKIDEKQFYKIKNMVEERVKQQTNKIKLIIENQISKISHELKWEINNEKKQMTPIKSRLKYSFRSTKIVHHEYIEAPYKEKDHSRISTRQSSESPRSPKILMNNETTYYIDRQGFLLDENNYYLLDSEQKMIRLTSRMIDELRRQGMLQPPMI